MIGAPWYKWCCAFLPGRCHGNGRTPGWTAASGAENHQQNDCDQDQARGPDRRAQTRGPVAGLRGRVIGAGRPCLAPFCREFVGHGWRRTAPRETEARTPSIVSMAAGPVC